MGAAAAAAVAPIFDAPSSALAGAARSIVDLIRGNPTPEALAEVGKRLELLAGSIATLRAQTIANEASLVALRSREDVLAAVPAEMIANGCRKIDEVLPGLRESSAGLDLAVLEAATIPPPFGPRLLEAVTGARETLAAFVRMTEATADLFTWELDSRLAAELIKRPRGGTTAAEARKTFDL